jgi:hypothetical protein
LLLAVAQLVLPRIATRILREKVARYGEVRSASVSALPAVQLLWGSADSASLTAGRLSIAPHELVNLLKQAKMVQELTVSASSVELLDPGFGAGAVQLRRAVLEKHGDELVISALLDDAALDDALPNGMHAKVLRAEADGVLVRGGGQLFGFGATLEGRVEASKGKLLLIPTAPSFARHARITLFSDRRLAVRSVSAKAKGQDWLIELRARLR